MSVGHPVSSVQVPSEGPPQMGDGLVCEVPPDGLCLYHCFNAAVDVHAFSNGRNPRGFHPDQDRSETDRRAAVLILESVVNAANAAGDLENAHRLTLGGEAGYPGLDEVKYLAHVGNCRIDVVLEIGGDAPSREVVTYGEGKLRMAIQPCTISDGAGHESSHWRLLQSWVPLPIPLHDVGGPSATATLNDVIPGVCFF